MKITTALLAAASLLSACSSSEPAAADNDSGQGRLMRASNEKPSYEKRSAFERQRQTTGQKSSIAGFFQRKTMKSSSFTGKKSFYSGGDYKAGEFSQSTKRSNAADKDFSGAGQRFDQADGTPRDAGKSFATSGSRYQNQPADQQGAAFTSADERFGTSPVRDALKSQKKNVRPPIIANPARQEGKTAYTEDEVKRMVNRN